MQRPTQAVILAGGQGKRLAPLTHSRPKPMIEFHGKPFLEYLIELLRDQGFKRVLLLLGYLPDVIQSYFGDGRRFGVSIEYSISDVEDDTGRRMKLAQSQIDPVFLLLYCDNYWPMRFQEMWKQFVGTDAAAQVTYYLNKDHYTASNLRVDADGYVVAYQRSRKAPGLSGVDIGFLISRRSVIDLLPSGNPSFEEVIYPQLIAERRLRGYGTSHRYYSVGSWERLHLTAEFLARRPTVLVDRDGVLNRGMPRASYVRSWAEWEWVPGAREGLRLLREAGYRVIVVTNQPGVSRGELTESALGEIHARMKAEAREAGGNICAIYWCPHGWDEGCECRKPKPGLLFQAQREFSLDLSQVCYFGDDERDGEAARAAGCHWVQVSEEANLLCAVTQLLKAKETEFKNAKGLKCLGAC